MTELHACNVSEQKGGLFNLGQGLQGSFSRNHWDLVKRKKEVKQMFQKDKTPLNNDLGT